MPMALDRFRRNQLLTLAVMGVHPLSVPPSASSRKER
jgi:hypothetical protein